MVEQISPGHGRLERWRRTITEAADAMVKAGTNDAALLGFMRMTAAALEDEPKRIERIEEEKRRNREYGRRHYDMFLRKKPRSK